MEYTDQRSKLSCLIMKDTRIAALTPELRDSIEGVCQKVNDLLQNKGFVCHSDDETAQLWAFAKSLHTPGMLLYIEVLLTEIDRLKSASTSIH